MFDKQILSYLPLSTILSSATISRVTYIKRKYPYYYPLTVKKLGTSKRNLTQSSGLSSFYVFTSIARNINSPITAPIAIASRKKRAGSRISRTMEKLGAISLTRT